MNTSTLQHQLGSLTCLSAPVSAPAAAHTVSSQLVFEAAAPAVGSTVGNPANAPHNRTAWLGGVDEMGPFSGKYATKRIHPGVLERDLT